MAVSSFDQQEPMSRTKGALVLEDGTRIVGDTFGYPRSVSGEVVFNTGMVGYPEALTDPSYKGQILVLSYPLIGNYGVSKDETVAGLPRGFESDRVHIRALIVSEHSRHYSHCLASKGLDEWLREHEVPALSGIDTRMLTKRLRDKGSMLGKVVQENDSVEFYDPNTDNLASMVSVERPVRYSKGEKTVVVIDCGAKSSIIRGLLERNVSVLRVPWNYDFLHETFDGVLVSNGPGDPKSCRDTITHIQNVMDRRIPVFGVCLGHQILALAAGADTYKMKFGHRSQNQPCVEVGTRRCYITSQNHGYAVRIESLQEGWEPWFVNANDGTNEGIRHHSLPFMSVQFHPEAEPGPVDTAHLFDKFTALLS
jgi:carbamoyl-phosphate synthase small subunit